MKQRKYVANLTCPQMVEDAQSALPIHHSLGHPQADGTANRCTHVIYSSLSILLFLSSFARQQHFRTHS